LDRKIIYIVFRWLVVRRNPRNVKVVKFAKCALDHQMRNISLKEFCRPEMNSSLIIRVSP